MKPLNSKSRDGSFWKRSQIYLGGQTEFCADRKDGMCMHGKVRGADGMHRDVTRCADNIRS